MRSSDNFTVVLMLDQSKIANQSKIAKDSECLMASVRVGNKVLSVF